MKKKYHPIVLPLLVFALFGFLMGIGIHWRAVNTETLAEIPSVSFLSVVFWQELIWLAWVGLFIGLRRVLLFLYTHARGEIKYWLYIGSFSLVAMALHYGWFVAVSDLFSPYHDFPDTRFGVFRYFFIFWLLIDALLVIGTLVLVLSRAEVDNRLQELVKEKNGADINNEDFLAVKVGNKQVIVSIDQILWIEADNYYAKLHTDDGCYLIRRTLSKLNDQLSEELFIRVHRSTIVNLKYVDSVKNSDGKYQVKLKNGENRAVSRSGFEELNKAIVRMG